MSLSEQIRNRVRARLNRLKSSRAARRNRAMHMARSMRQAELSYLRGLDRHVDANFKNAVIWIVRELKSLESEQEPIRQDALFDTIFRRLIDGFEFRLGKAENEIPESGLQGLVRKTSKKISGGHGKGILKLFGIKPAPTATVGAALDFFREANVDLISNMTKDQRLKMTKILREGLDSGTRVEDIARQIQVEFQITKNRAMLIGRDQVGKIQGQLTRVRSEEAGIVEYTWTTVGDERVRDEHARLDGKIFRYDSPPSEGNPGEAIQCRCFADPVLPEY